jgi:hypothetical protein
MLRPLRWQCQENGLMVGGHFLRMPVPSIHLTTTLPLREAQGRLRALAQVLVRQDVPD